MVRALLVLLLVGSCDNLLGLQQVGSGGSSVGDAARDSHSDSQAAVPCGSYGSASIISLDPSLDSVSELSVHDDGVHAVAVAEYQNDGDVRPRPLVLKGETWVDDTARDQFATDIELAEPIIDPTDPTAATMYIATPTSGDTPPYSDVEWTYNGTDWTDFATLDSGGSFQDTSYAPTGFGKVNGAKTIVEGVANAPGMTLQLLIEDSGSWQPDTTSLASISGGLPVVVGGTLTYDGLTIVYLQGTSIGAATLAFSKRASTMDVFPVGSPVSVPAAVTADGAQLVEPWLVGGDCSQLVVRAVGSSSSTFYTLSP